jgi:hypothetical protein
VNLVRMLGWTFVTRRELRRGEPIPAFRLQDPGA